MTDQEIICVLNDGGPYGMRIKGGIEFGCCVSVENVNPGSKADRAGVKQGDVILSINGTEVNGLTHEATKGLISKAGTKLELKLKRGSGSSTTSVKASPTTPATPSTSSQASTATSASSYTQAASPVSKPVQQASFQPASQPSYTQPEKAEPTQPTKSTTSSGSSGTPNLYSNPPPKANVVVKGVLTPGDLLKNKEPEKIAFNATEMKLKDLPAKDQFVKTTYTKDILAPEVNVGTCHKCNQRIGATKYLKLDNRIWHAEHFQCDGCQCVLASTGFYEENNKIYCKNCFGTLFAPKCAICNQSCIESYLTANDRAYHSTCFKCKKCQAPLAGKPLNFYDNYPHCMDCFSDVLSIRCDGCSNPIRPSEQYLEVKNKQYHEDCFRCATCNQSLANKGKYVVRDGKPNCPNH